MPNYKKRSTYQTGGAAKPQPPSRQQMQQVLGRTQPRLPNNGFSQFSRENNEALSAQRQAMQRAAGLAALGNRQRAAAARARAQRPAQGPSRAQAARNQAEYNAAMRARQAASSRGSTPARPRVPTAQQRADYQRMLSEVNRGCANSVPVTPRQQPRPQMRTPTPQELARLQANPNRPNMVNQVQNMNVGAGSVFTQQMQAERSRIQQQIAQLQARLRQLGG